MVNATVCESDTQIKSDKTAPAKQPYFHCSVQCSSSYSLHKFGDPAKPWFNIPEIMFFGFQCTFKYIYKPTKVHTLGLVFTLLDPGPHLPHPSTPNYAPLVERAQHMAGVEGLHPPLKKCLDFFFNKAIIEPFFLGYLLNNTPTDTEG